MSRKPIKEITYAELFDLYITQNKSQQEIADIYQCGHATIGNYLKKYNISHKKLLSKDELFNLYITQNKSQQEIATIYGVATSTISMHLLKYNIEKQNTSPTKKELYDLYITQNKSQQEIADIYKLSKTTIRNYLHKYKIHKEIPTLSNVALCDTIKSYITAHGNKPTIAELSTITNYSLSHISQQINNFNLNDCISHNNHESNSQKELKSEIEKLFITAGKPIPEIRINDTAIIYPKEIDIYIPEYNFGIEFNGGFWHSEIKRDKNYHYNKSKSAENKGIFIYHIFSYEWENVDRRLKILNQIQNLLRLNTTKIYARKCEIRDVTPKEKSNFLEANHVQGNDRSSIKLGLFYNDELVSLMTFTKPRFSNKYTWELSRFCSKAGCNVTGGASKLFKYFINNYLNKDETIVSYSDIAKTKGNLYENLGFTYLHVSKPNYIWWKNDDDFKTRYQCQMKNEAKIMQQKKYHRIYDCGNKVWIYTK